MFTWLHPLRSPVNRRTFLTCLSLPALVSLLGACTVTQALPTPGAGWDSHTGQLLYRGPKDRSVIGDVVVRHSGRSDFALNFLSGPGFPLLKLQVSGDDVVAEGVLARGRWRGKVQKAPKTLQGWIALREVFVRLPADQTTGGWTTKARYSGSRLEHLDTRFAPAGERFAFHFGS